IFLINKEIQAYHKAQSKTDNVICDLHYNEITAALPDAESKIWHRPPVCCLNVNPIVGYSKQKDCICLMFWGAAEFDVEALQPGTGKFKDASARYTSEDEVKTKDLKRWLRKAREIQWDYKNIMKRKGKLERLH